LALVIPPFRPYPQPIAPLPSRERDEPPEGRQYASLEFDWFNAGQCQLVDVGQRSTRPFSQILMLDVDNSRCTSDVRFIFPDTQLTVTVPAGSSGRYVAPTSGVRFYANAVDNGLSGEITRAAALNYFSRPLDVPPTEFNSIGNEHTIDLSVMGTTNILSNTVSGILTSLTLQQYNVTPGAAAASVLITLQDGTGAVIMYSGLSGPAGGTMLVPSVIFSRDNYNVRFSQGLNIVTSGNPFSASAFLIADFTYRQAT
jgi:hypothetical protein